MRHLTLRLATPLVVAGALAIGGHSAAAQAPAAAPTATAPSAAPAVTATAAPVRPARQSWTSPRRAFTVGDVVTVLVDEYTLASANTGNSATDTRRRDLGLNGGFSSGATGTSVRGSVGTNNASSSNQRGEAVRQNRFQSEMSVRIVGVDPASGLLELKGSKLVDVDRNKQEITFTGWVRPQDVSAQNQVESWRVADAQLLYTSEGSLGKPKGSIVGRILGAVWP
jgi:flagellar L-ring protein precursor FlgH